MMFVKDSVYNKSFIINESIYNGFIACSSDKNPLHIDDTFAKSKGFPKKVMHGNILNALISYFIGECLETKNVLIQSQSINFSNPFFLGDNLQLEAIIENIYDSVNTVEFKFKFYNKENNLKIAYGKIFISIIL